MAAIIIDSKSLPANQTTGAYRVGSAAPIASAPNIAYGSTRVSSIGVAPIDITTFPNTETEVVAAAPPTPQTMPSISVPPIIDNQALTTPKQSLRLSHIPTTTVRSLRHDNHP